jgi:quinoprotein glucose dehydrogenase
LTVQGLPIIKPPYGRITALDMNKGTLAWQIAHGETPDNIKNHPALKGLTIPRTGRQGRIGVLVTKNLVIAGEGGFFTTPKGPRGAMLRAYDKATRPGNRAVYASPADRLTPMSISAQRKQPHCPRHAARLTGSRQVAFKLPCSSPRRRRSGSCLGGDLCG